MFLLHEFEGTESANIDATPDEVFAVITDVDRLPQWNRRIHHVVKQPNEPLGPGVEWVVEMHAMGSKWNSVAAVTEYDPGRHVFAHESRTDDGNPSRAAWRWEIQPAGDGRSNLTVNWRVNPRSFWRQVLFAKIRRRQLVDELPLSLNALRVVVAQRSPAH